MLPMPPAMWASQLIGGPWDAFFHSGGMRTSVPTIRRQGPFVNRGVTGVPVGIPVSSPAPNQL